MQLDADWSFVADNVMGGASTGTMTREPLAGRQAARLSGNVSLDNNGGFIQMAFDVSENATGWSGLTLEVMGNGKRYELRLKTDQLTRPWQSFRISFEAPYKWTSLQFPFHDFEPYRTDAAFDPAGLRRIGVLAVGRAYEANVAVASIGLFR